MSLTKRWLEQKSVEYGYDGAITDELLERLQDGPDPDEELLTREVPYPDEAFEGLVECKGCNCLFATEDSSDEFCGRCSSLLNEGEVY